MGPKKEKKQVMSLGDFLAGGDSFGGSWADEVEEFSASGTQPLPPMLDRRTGSSGFGGDRFQDRGYSSIRDNLPQKLPDKAPFTAHLGNLSYDATEETVSDFFEGCNVVNIRIIEDREQNRPKGFAYAEFQDIESLKQALTLDGRQFQGRNIRIKVADPPKDKYGGGESNRDLNDWTRKGPLADVQGSRPERRGTDFGDRRLREFQADDGKTRDLGNWERRGPLSPIQQAEPPPSSRDGSRAPRMDRSESYRGNSRESPAWGPGELHADGSRPPRREFVDRPERIPSAAEKDMHWRTSMRPDATKETIQLQEGSEAPLSPATQAAAPAAPAGRPRLQLAKRTVSEALDALSPASTADIKVSPFGAARPIDTAAREKMIEDKRQQSIKEKQEAEEKAKEERRLATEAFDKEAAEKAAEAAANYAKETSKTDAETPAPVKATAKDEPVSNDNPSEQKIATRAREPSYKSRATESFNWRDQKEPSGEPRVPSSGRGGRGDRRGGGPPRGPRNDVPRPPRTNGNSPLPRRPSQPSQSAETAQSPSTPVIDEDGWTTVPGKRVRGLPNRA